MYLEHTEIQGNTGQGLHPINVHKKSIQKRESSIVMRFLVEDEDDVMP